MNNIEKELLALFADPAYGITLKTIRRIRFPANYRFESHAHPETELHQFRLLYDGGGRAGYPPQAGKLHNGKSVQEASFYGGCEQILCHNPADIPGGAPRADTGLPSLF